MIPVPLPASTGLNTMTAQLTMPPTEGNVKVECETGNCLPEQQEKEDVMNWKTFTPPITNITSLSNDRTIPGIVIEFCNRCRWLHRATWIQTELFLTFEDKAQEEKKEESTNKGKYASSQGLKSIQLIPCNAPETGGRFRVWLYHTGTKTNSPQSDQKRSHGSFEDGKIVLLWDRKIRGGFPELKELKQIVRDEIAPQHSLGHSDGNH